MRWAEKKKSNHSFIIRPDTWLLFRLDRMFESFFRFATPTQHPPQMPEIVHGRPFASGITSQIERSSTPLSSPAPGLWSPKEPATAPGAYSSLSSTATANLFDELFPDRPGSLAAQDQQRADRWVLPGGSNEFGFNGKFHVSESFLILIALIRLVSFALVW
jgi:hypothetical protein